VRPVSHHIPRRSGYRPRQDVSPGSSLRPAAPHIPLRQRGHSHGRALRTVADRLLSVACTLLEQQTVFDPTYKFTRPPAREHTVSIPLFDRKTAISSSRPASWQSAARSGSQRCRRECGGTGEAGAKRP